MNKHTIRLFAFCAILLLVALTGLWLFMRSHTVFSARMESSNKIGLTPEQIQSIKDIGQWEFLSISEEELVDTTRKGLFSDDHLVRIYQGTLRIGVDLQQLDEQSISFIGDTLCIELPPIHLLDEDFVDEANSRSFHESGRWSSNAREALYQKAKLQMKAHALTPENYQQAQAYGETEVERLLRNMGFEHTMISFQTAKP